MSERNEALPVDEHDPAGLKHRLEREVAHKIANGSEPAEAAKWARLEEARVYASEAEGVLVHKTDGSIGRYDH